MAAYRRVDDLSHLRADCLYTGPNAYLLLIKCLVKLFMQLITNSYRTVNL